MRFILVYSLLGLLGIANTGYSQEVPDGLKQIMTKLQTNQEAEFGYSFAKAWRFLAQNVPFENWYVGLPIEEFKISNEKIGNASADSRIDEVIEPTNTWYVPIAIKDSGYLYHVEVQLENNEFKAIGSGEDVLGFRVWDEVRRRYPEESGIMPVVIGMRPRFLYFPNEKQGKNVYCIKNPKYENELSVTTSSSVDSLFESKIFIKYWKDDDEKNRESRKIFLEKNPGLFGNEVICLIFRDNRHNKGLVWFRALR